MTPDPCQPLLSVGLGGVFWLLLGIRVLVCMCALGLWMVCTFLGLCWQAGTAAPSCVDDLARNCVAATHNCTLLSVCNADHAVAHTVSCVTLVRACSYDCLQPD